MNGHYATRRDENAGYPFIDDLFETGNYLTLFVPYREMQAFGSLQKNCPNVDAAVAKSQARGNPLLACYARLHPVSLDGIVVADIAFDVARDPKSGQRGMFGIT